jgi:hypothetical protein
MSPSSHSLSGHATTQALRILSADTYREQGAINFLVTLSQAGTKEEDKTTLPNNYVGTDSVEYDVNGVCKQTLKLRGGGGASDMARPCGRPLHSTYLHTHPCGTHTPTHQTRHPSSRMHLCPLCPLPPAPCPLPFCPLTTGVKYIDGKKCYTDVCLKNTLAYMNKHPGTTSLDANAKVRHGGRPQRPGTSTNVHRGALLHNSSCAQVFEAVMLLSSHPSGSTLFAGTPRDVWHFIRAPCTCSREHLALLRCCCLQSTGTAGPLARQDLLLVLWAPVVIICLLGLWALTCACCCCRRKPSWQKVKVCGCFCCSWCVLNRHMGALLSPTASSVLLCDTRQKCTEHCPPVLLPCMCVCHRCPCRG